MSVQNQNKGSARAGSLGPELPLRPQARRAAQGPGSGSGSPRRAGLWSGAFDMALQE